MSLDQLMTKAPAMKPPGYVAEKIAKKQNRPNRGSRARKEWRGSLAKVIKKAASIAELLTVDDQEQNLRVIRESRKATHRVFNLETKKMENVPDHKTRLAAVMLDLEYTEGKPVERQIRLDANFTELRDEVEAFKRSPAMQDFARRLASGEIQISGGEKQVENAREIPPTTPVQQSTDS
jgi:hypothetical protein